MNVSLFDDVFNLIVRTLNFDTLLSQSQTKQHLEQAGNRTRTLRVKHKYEIYNISNSFGSRVTDLHHKMFRGCLKAKKG